MDCVASVIDILVVIDLWLCLTEYLKYFFFNDCVISIFCVNVIKNTVLLYNHSPEDDIITTYISLVKKKLAKIFIDKNRRLLQVTISK